MTASERLAYGRVVINDSSIELTRASLPAVIAAAIESIRRQPLPARWKVKIELSSHALADAAPGDGNMSDDSLMASILALAKPADESESLDDREADPLWQRYLAMHSPAQRERETPESLAHLRQHVERTYPEYVKRFGHHF